MLPKILGWLLVLGCVLTAFMSFGQENTVKERTVYVPYGKLRNIFEQPGRGVFVPYNEFKLLWDAAQTQQAVKPAEAAPVAAMITQTVNTATITEEVVQVESTIFIELLKDGWHEIPLQLADAAITKAQIGEEKAKILGSPNGGYRLLIEKKKAADAENQTENKTGDKTENNERKPERLELTLHYARSIEKSPGRNSVSFEVPQSPLGRWKVVVPESGVKIDFSPLVAAVEQQTKTDTETDAKTDTKTDSKPDTETVFEAFVGTTPKIQIAWTPKAEGATGLDALTSVQLLQQTIIDEGILRTSARFDYSISRAAISNLAIRVPGDQKIVGVFDPNIRKWSVEQKDDAPIIRIELFEPAKERQSVQLELEKLRNNKETNSKQEAGGERSIIPGLAAVDADRQQGILVVFSVGELSTETVKSTGLLRMDASELPESLRQTGKIWDAAYRLSSTSYELELAVNKVEPRITAVSQITLRLLENGFRTEMNTMFDIERAGVFQLSFEIPANCQASATGFSFGSPDIVAAAVDSVVHSSAEKDAKTQTLIVNLKKKALGKVGLQISYFKPLNEPDLQSPTGKSVDIPVLLPTLGQGIAERYEGKLLLAAGNAFRVNALETEGLQLVSVQQIGMDWNQPTNDAQLGFLVADSAAKLTLRAERRKPQLTLRELRTVRIEDGSIKHNSKFYYEILFSGVKSLRIDVPENLSGRLNLTRTARADNTGIDWRESMIVPQPDDVAEGYVAWEFATKSNLIGSGVLDVSWEDELTQLEVGKSLPIDIPRLLPRKQQPSDRIWGQILISKSQSIDLGESETTKGLKPIDPQYDITDLQEKDRINDAVAAFEFHDDWSLQLIATRYKLEEVKRTSIETGLVRVNLMFSKFGSDYSAQALYRIRSVQQRLELAMPTDSTISDIRINGQSVALESDNAAGPTPRFMIPLTSVPPDTPFLLDIRYTSTSHQKAVEIPSFPAPAGSPAPAVQKIHLAVYVPEEWVITGYKGIWSKNFWFVHGSEATGIQNQPDISSVLPELLNGLSNDFSVAGTPYLFSTLSPQEGNALNLYFAGDLQCGLVFFLGIVIIGLGLLRCSWTKRFQIVLGVLILCVLLGFVYPTFALLLLVKSTPGWGIAIVTVCWILQAVVQYSTVQRFTVSPQPPLENQPVAPVPTEEKAEEKIGEKEEHHDA